MGAFVDVVVTAVSAVLLGFLVYGGWLVAGGGGFHRDAPEDPCRPRLDLLQDL
jgi:hypothetical protein